MKYFECNSCGNCCKNEISLTLDEMYKHIDNFPFIGTYTYTTISDNEKFCEQKNPLHFQSDAFNQKVVVCPEIISLTDGDKCLQLGDDNRCNIYESRPSVCALYPIRIDRTADDVQQGLRSEFESSLIENNSLACEGWKYPNKKFIPTKPNQIDINLLKSRTSADKITLLLMRDYFKTIDSTERFQSKVLQNKKGTFIVYLSDFLNYLFEIDIISQNDLAQLVHAQKNVFTSFIAKNEHNLLGTSNNQRLLKLAKANLDKLNAVPVSF